ncbi:MAG: hypothetical protein JF586_12980 [Burkholderiales bacterium]|nr:hypothetical protein [Burkholderiales bacterium]
MTRLLLWLRAHKSSAAGAVLVVVGCIALLMLSRKVHHLSPRHAPVASAPAGAASVAAPVNGLTPSDTAGTEQSSRSARMRTGFENATSYLDFIGQAMSRPQEGGKFYALLAWKRCNDLTQHRGVAATHTGDDAFFEGALALVQDVEKRCTGVLETYPDVLALYKIAVEQRGGRDFLLPENGRGIVTPTSRENANADIDAALRTGDRWAAAEALQNNAAFLDVGNSAGDDGVDRQLHEWAAETVACELVSSCHGGLEAALHCVGTGDCAHDDYRDVVLAKVPDTHRMVFDTMLAGMHARVGLMPGPPGADR